MDRFVWCHPGSSSVQEGDPSPVPYFSNLHRVRTVCFSPLYSECSLMVARSRYVSPFSRGRWTGRPSSRTRSKSGGLVVNQTRAFPAVSLNRNTNLSPYMVSNDVRKTSSSSSSRRCFSSPTHSLLAFWASRSLRSSSFFSSNVTRPHFVLLSHQSRCRSSCASSRAR